MNVLLRNLLRLFAALFALGLASTPAFASGWNLRGRRERPCHRPKARV